MQKYLATYLQDHAAGSETALAITRKLQHKLPTTPLAEFAKDFEVELGLERKILFTLLERAKPSPLAHARRFIGAVGAQVTSTKLLADSLANRDFYAFESLEALSLGVEGKRRLWKLLRESSLDEVKGISFVRFFAYLVAMDDVEPTFWMWQADPLTSADCRHRYVRG